MVRADSKYTTLKQLVDDVKANPTSVKWGGGSAGGTDQILVGLLAKAAGADAKTVAKQYVAYSGGGEAKAALLSGDIERGRVQRQRVRRPGQGRHRCGRWRCPARSGEDAGAGTPAPTHQGVRVRRRADELARHRGPARAQRRASATAVIELVDKLHSSPRVEAGR